MRFILLSYSLTLITALPGAIVGLNNSVDSSTCTTTETPAATTAEIFIATAAVATAVATVLGTTAGITGTTTCASMDIVADIEADIKNLLVSLTTIIQDLKTGGDLGTDLGTAFTSQCTAVEQLIVDLATKSLKIDFTCIGFGNIVTFCGGIMQIFAALCTFLTTLITFLVQSPAQIGTEVFTACLKIPEALITAVTGLGTKFPLISLLTQFLVGQTQTLLTSAHTTGLKAGL